MALALVRDCPVLNPYHYLVQRTVGGVGDWLLRPLIENSKGLVHCMPPLRELLVELLLEVVAGLAVAVWAVVAVVVDANE